MNSPNGFFQKMVNLEGRSFSLQIQKFENGYFVSVTEGTNKIGSMVVSLATGPTPITTTIIPSRTESLFLKLVAERISTKMRGIALVSTFIQKELEPNTAKALMSEIMEMMEND
ncbi:MAG: proteasome assembly chaperone 4 [Nitrosopumilus sp.]